MNLAELEARANEVMDEEARSYVARGAGANATRDANTAAWAAWGLCPHVLRDVGHVETATTVLGVPVRMPVLVAPTAMQMLAHPDGERATARAAAAAGTVYVASMTASQPWRDIAAAAGPWFAQFYLLRDRRRTRALVDEAAALGARALVVSVDGAAVPYGEARRSADAIVLPDEVRTVVDAFDPSVTLRDVLEVRDWSPLPLVVKGVLRGDDAGACVDAGVDAVYVSNHGGRLVDGCVDTAAALADVVAAVEGRAPVFVDGGIRSGVDVLRALALGAQAVLLGRPVWWGLALDGEAGAAAVLDAFAVELRRAMAFCGAAALTDLTRDLLLRSPR